ncbi:hypothetical protein [Coraliomargarita akajimensis]|uniref:Uncharacterized protein n=1 Tax=Coraliomargarita akajimensis (strain DSM 45221 / IAM 15411 / JCM 23193 / KCTC 12865 / 04OKA010-24) TaxID=583355 RepID=D5EPT2_CORAD|nr:hypothetical protein [Coraliomargarita akajimensis]ADE55665.1 hypothetical protein Caka_2649 [Coraliomargarita akajimensis DSM 45221]
MDAPAAVAATSVKLCRCLLVKFIEQGSCCYRDFIDCAEDVEVIGVGRIVDTANAVK